MEKVTLSQKLARFEGVFCSGFFIPDQAVVTALALLFDKIHFLNQLEYTIEVSKFYRIEHPDIDSVSKIVLTPIDHDEEDPLVNLSTDQRMTVNTYLYLSDQFFSRNALLFPDIFHCSLLPNSEVLTAELIEKGKPGQLNRYRVTRNPLTVSVGGNNELNKLLKSGCVPIVGGIVPTKTANDSFSATQIAAALAIKSIAMVLPGTKPAESQDILEARYKLRDHLPPFWSSMLKLSVELSGCLNAQADENALQKEVDHAVTTIVRPALIDLVSKLEKERKQWFFRILSPLAKGLRVLVGKPPTDLASFITNSLTIGANVACDVAHQLRKVDALKEESGLTYIIELHKILGASNAPAIKD